VIWLTGLSGSGKTTIAKTLERELYKRGFLAQVLDGDNIRTGINNNLGFTEEDRIENIRRIAEVSKLFLNCGIITINSFISPTEEIRKMAMEIIGEENFFEIYVNAPLEVCEERDTKGLYKKAREGKIADFTGISAPFEVPKNPHLEVRTDQMTVDETIEECLAHVLPVITLDREK
jgi:adenylylsulfate kinase